MRKLNQIVLSVMLCGAMVLSSGCSLGDKLSGITKKEKADSDYVTLANYKEISLSTEEIDAEVQSQIDETLDTYASYKKLKKGKVKDGDVVNIYYVGKVNGKKFDGGSCTKKDTPDGYNLTIGSDTFIDGFEDGLIGAGVGETLDVDVTFPEEYSNNEDLAGKDAVFTVTINYIQGEKVLPELDDEFVTTNLTAYDSVEDYKNTLRTHTLEDMAWDNVYTNSKVNDYPKDKVDSMYDQLYTSINYYLTQNNYTLSDYLSTQNTTSEDFKSQLRDTAQTDVGKQLIYDTIAKNEKIEVSEEEYQEELESYLSTYGCDDEDALNEVFQSYYGTDAKELIMDDLLYKKVKTYLAGNIVETTGDAADDSSEE